MRIEGKYALLDADPASRALLEVEQLELAREQDRVRRRRVVEAEIDDASAREVASMQQQADDMTHSAWTGMALGVAGGAASAGAAGWASSSAESTSANAPPLGSRLLGTTGETLGRAAPYAAKLNGEVAERRDEADAVAIRHRAERLKAELDEVRDERAEAEKSRQQALETLGSIAESKRQMALGAIRG